jgi:diacylglycerol kinase family enzyme
VEVLLLANANASGVGDDSLRDARDALIGCGADVEAYATAAADDFRNALTRAAGRRIALLGGDGSLQAAVNLGFAACEFALLPAGGANNVATSLGIPTELDEAAALAVGGSLRRLDLIDVVRGGISYYAVEGVSVGVHAVARAQYRSPNSTDALAALKAAAKAARHFTGTTITAAFAGERLRVRVAQLFVANLPLFAFGLEVAPEASPDDGRLELVVNRWSGRTALIPLLVYLRRGTHLESTKTNSWSVERVTIDPGVSPIVADSTNLGRGPVEVSVKPGALNLVAP